MQPLHKTASPNTHTPEELLDSPAPGPTTISGSGLLWAIHSFLSWFMKTRWGGVSPFHAQGNLVLLGPHWLPGKGLPPVPSPAQECALDSFSD